MIKRVREATGAPIVDCKRALQASGCDLPAAEDWLRKKGMAAMLKKVDRVANQGMIALTVDAGGRRGALVEVRASHPAPPSFPGAPARPVSRRRPPLFPVQLNSETDFVARNAVFQTLASSLAASALSLLPPSQSTTSSALGGAAAAEGAAALLAGGLAAAVAEAAAKIRENLVLRRAATLCGGPGGVVCGYTHGAAAPGVGAIGVLVALAPAAPGAPPLAPANAALLALGKRLAMHVAASRPGVVSREDVPPEALERERAVVAAQVAAAAGSGKASEVVEKMVVGRLSKFYADVALLEQPFALPEEGEKARRVDAWLAGAAKAAGLPPLRVAGFAHMGVGGGGAPT